MSVDVLALGLVLLAAVLHAVWNALVKGESDRTVALAGVLFTGVLVGSVVVVLTPLPAREAWPWLVGSAVTHGAYYACLLGAYRTGDLGHVYPIARGSAPLLVAVGTFALVPAAQMSGIEVAGAVLVSLGIASLALGGATQASGRAVTWALATGVTIAAYTVFDGNGARAAGDEAAHAVGYGGWSFVVQLPGIAVLALVAGRERVVAFAKRAWWKAVLGGLVSAGAWIIVLWAMTRLPIAHVAALRETSVVFAAILGALLLHEPLGVRRVVAAAVVAAGVVVMHLA